VPSLPKLEDECFFIAPIGKDGSEERHRSDGVLEFIVARAAQEHVAPPMPADHVVALPAVDEVRFIEGPTRLVVKAGPALAGDPAGRAWVEHGRLAGDFAWPIEVEWRFSGDGRLHTFHVLDAVPLGVGRIQNPSARRASQ